MKRPILVAFFINNYMITLVVLNIILVISLVVLLIYLFGNKKDSIKKDSIHVDEIKNINSKKNKKINSDRVFEGRFITDEEYNQMIKLKRNDYAFSFEEVELEYEHLKELNK